MGESIAQDISFYDDHKTIWQYAQKGGTTAVHAIQLNDVKVISDPKQNSQDSVPDTFSIQGNFDLYGTTKAQLTSVHSLVEPGVHYIVTIPTNPLSIGTLLPFLDQAPFNAIQLLDTKLVYRSHPTETEYAGLVFSTTLLFSGPLEFINTLLRDVFQQESPHVKFSGLLSTHPDGVRHHPKPLGFTLRGMIDDLNVNLFGLVKITTLGIDVTWVRRSSYGDYDDAYGFFGSGSIDEVPVRWYLSKHDDVYGIMIAAQSEKWTDIGGMPGIDVENVMLRAVWMGKASQLSLELQCTMSLSRSTLILQGSYSSDHLEVSGSLYDFSLQDLQDMYQHMFKEKISIDTSHDITISELCIRIVKGKCITLSGAVTVDGHTAAAAIIELDKSGVRIIGDIDSLTVCGVEIISPALNVNIGTGHFSVQFSGQVRVHKHRFTVDVYLSKSSGNKLEYTVYGEYNGSFKVGELLADLAGTGDADFLNVTIQSAAVCVSNANEPCLSVSTSASAAGYRLRRGFSVYVKAMAPPVVQGLLQLDAKAPAPITFWAFTSYARGALNFEIAIQLPLGQLITFDGVQCTSLALAIEMSNRGPGIKAIADLSIAVPQQVNPLILLLTLSADIKGAQGSADMDTTWVNPFGLCKNLSIYSLRAGIGANYQQLISTGLPSKLELSGHFTIGTLTGGFDMSLASDSSNQLLDLELKNLDIMKLVQLIADLLDVKISVPRSAEILYIHQLRIFFSTGMEYRDVYYDPGIELDAKLTVFGKRTRVHGIVTETDVEFDGKIDRFQLGAVHVSGADRRSGPRLRITISADEQVLIVDGRIEVGDNYVAIKLTGDTRTRLLEFSFHLELFDDLRIDVHAMLNGQMPQITPARATPETPSGPVSIRGGELEGRTFCIHLEMKQNILRSIVHNVTSQLDRGPFHEVKFVLKGLEEVGKHLLDIRSITVDADAWSGAAHLTARVKCQIASMEHTFDMDFEITNFYEDFLDEIKSVLRDVCGSVTDVVKKLEDDFKLFISLAEKTFIQLTSDCELQIDAGLCKGLPFDLITSLAAAGVVGADDLLREVEGIVQFMPIYQVVDGIIRRKPALEVVKDAIVKPIEKVAPAARDVAEFMPIFHVVDGIIQEKPAEEVVKDVIVKPIEKVGNVIGDIGKGIGSLFG